MSSSERFIEERARDELTFDPLPLSDYLTIKENGIYISVRYSEPLSRILHAIPGAHWLREQRSWQYPFSAAPAIRKALPEIERLAAEAMDAAEEETRRREARAASARSERRQAEAARDQQRMATRPRPFLRDFIVSPPGSPLVMVQLEEFDAEYSPRASQPWVAQLMGSNGKGGWARSFLAFQRDYSKANSKGTRGILRCYLLERGMIYEIHTRTSWRGGERKIVRVIDGVLTPLSKEELMSCLEK